MAGGAQRTEAVTHTPSRRRPSPAPHRRRLVGQPGPVERAEQPVAGAVTGEHPPRSVPAVGGGSQARRRRSTRRGRRSRARAGPSTPRDGRRPGGSPPPPPARPPTGGRPGRPRSHPRGVRRAVRPAPGLAVFHARDTRLTGRDGDPSEADGAPPCDAPRPPRHPGVAGPPRHHAQHRPGAARPGAGPAPGRRRPRNRPPGWRNAWPPGRLPTGPGPGSRLSTPRRSNGPGKPPPPSPAPSASGSGWRAA